MRGEGEKEEILAKERGVKKKEEGEWKGERN